MNESNPSQNPSEQGLSKQGLSERGLDPVAAAHPAGEGGTENPPLVRAGATMSSGARILEPEAARDFAIQAAQSLVDDKCTQVEVIDVSGLSPVTGFIVIGSGTSARQMRSALQNLDELAHELGTSAYHISEDNDALWLLADFVDVVVHLFEPNARAHYDLEGLWFKGKRLDVPPSERSRRGKGKDDPA